MYCCSQELILVLTLRKVAKFSIQKVWAHLSACSHANQNGWECRSHINMSIYISTNRYHRSGHLILDVAHARSILLRASCAGRRRGQIQQRHRKGSIQGRWQRKKRPNIHTNTHPRGRWSCGATQGRHVAESERSISGAVTCQNFAFEVGLVQWKTQYRVHGDVFCINQLAIRWRNI